MKKPLLILSVLSIWTSINAQTLTQADEPSIGDSRTMNLVDSFMVDKEAITGTNITWDYSDLWGYENQTRTIDVVDESANATFTSAEYSIVVQDNINPFYSSTTDSLMSHGFKFDVLGLGEVTAKCDANNLETLRTYPFGYNQPVEREFSGTFSYSIVQGPFTGNVLSVMDGAGTLVLPENVSLPNVVRVKTIDTLDGEIQGNIVKVFRKQFEYYDLNDATSKLPVLTKAHLTIEFNGAANNFEYALCAYETVGLNENDIIDFTVYPNPVKDELTITGEFTNDATGKITDQSGRVISTFDVSNNKTINMSSYKTGAYLIQINDRNNTTTKSIMKL